MRSKIKAIGFEIEGEFPYSDFEFEKSLITSGVPRTTHSDGSLRSCEELIRKCVRKELTKLEMVCGPVDIKDMAKVRKFFVALQKQREDKNMCYNESCGFHVHVSFKPKIAPEIFSKQFGDYFIERMKKKFPVEYATRKDNHYCKSHPLTDEEIVGNMQHPGGTYSGGERYRFINYRAYKKHGTVEFRIFPTNEPMIMYEYVLFTLDTIRFFMKKPLLTEVKDRFVSHPLVNEPMKVVSTHFGSPHDWSVVRNGPRVLHPACDLFRSAGVADSREFGTYMKPVITFYGGIVNELNAVGDASGVVEDLDDVPFEITDDPDE